GRHQAVPRAPSRRPGRRGDEGSCRIASLRNPAAIPPDLSNSVSDTGKGIISDGFRVFADIARFRKGPEDVPASTTLLAVAIAGAVLLRALLLGLLPVSTGGSPVLVIGDGVGVMLLYLWL